MAVLPMHIRLVLSLLTVICLTGPTDSRKYPIAMDLSDTKPKNEADFSGFFQLGYRLDNHRYTVAFIITDDDFIEDIFENVRWNTQDGLN